MSYNVLFSKLIDGSFPPFHDVIPKETSFSVTFDAPVLLSAVRKAALLTDPASKSVCFTFSGGELSISSRAADRGEARITVPVGCAHDQDFSIHFNPDYIADCIKVIESESISMDFTSSAQQAVMRTVGEFRYVLMPVTPNEA